MKEEAARILNAAKKEKISTVFSVSFSFFVSTIFIEGCVIFFLFHPPVGKIQDIANQGGPEIQVSRGADQQGPVFRGLMDLYWLEFEFG